MKSIFVDTMVLLHFRPLRELPLLELADAKSVRLVLPYNTIRELDKHKSSHTLRKIRERARRVIAELYGYLERNEEITANVALEYLGTYPDIDFESLGLSENCPDDVFIAAAIWYRDQAGTPEVCLLTDDTGVRLKAPRHGLQVLPLDDDLRLPEPPDSLEAENLKLRKQIAALENAAPSLALEFEDGGVVNTLWVFPQPELDEEALRLAAENAVNKLREKLAYPPPLPGVFGGFLSPSAEEVDEYNNKLEEYLERYPGYLRCLAEWERDRERIYELRFVLVNRGGAPAEDIDVTLHFPIDVPVVEEDGLPEKPFPIPAPRRPTTPAERLQSMSAGITFPAPILRTPYESIIGDFPDEFATNVSKPKIRKVDSYVVSFHVDRLKHDQSAPADPLYLVCSGLEPSSFTLDYKINAGNVPEIKRGELSVTFEFKQRPEE